MFIPKDTERVVGYVAPGTSGSIPSYPVMVMKLLSDILKLTFESLAFAVHFSGRLQVSIIDFILRYDMSLRYIELTMLQSIGL